MQTEVQPYKPVFPTIGEAFAHIVIAKHVPQLYAKPDCACIVIV
jgi:hypothetical protein